MISDDDSVLIEKEKAKGNHPLVVPHVPTETASTPTRQGWAKLDTYPNTNRVLLKGCFQAQTLSALNMVDPLLGWLTGTKRFRGQIRILGDSRGAGSPPSVLTADPGSPAAAWLSSSTCRSARGTSDSLSLELNLWGSTF